MPALQVVVVRIDLPPLDRFSHLVDVVHFPSNLQFSLFLYLSLQLPPRLRHLPELHEVRVTLSCLPLLAVMSSRWSGTNLAKDIFLSVKALSMSVLS